jgi:hypothetical protein
VDTDACRLGSLVVILEVMPNMAAGNSIGNCGDFSSGLVAAELPPQRKKMPQEKEILVVTRPAVISFAAKQDTHEKRSVSSLERAPASRALQGASFFFAWRKCSHAVLP